ncbi:hypothetical protein GCM10020000_76350 [Streptomyces olivoverticillatus]
MCSRRPGRRAWKARSRSLGGEGLAALEDIGEVGQRRAAPLGGLGECFEDEVGCEQLVDAVVFQPSGQGVGVAADAVGGYDQGLAHDERGEDLLD